MQVYNFLLLFLLANPCVLVDENPCPPDEREKYSERWRKTKEIKAYYVISKMIGEYISLKWRAWAEFDYLYTRRVSYNLPVCRATSSNCGPCECSKKPLELYAGHPELGSYAEIIDFAQNYFTCSHYKFVDSVFARQLEAALKPSAKGCAENNATWDCMTDCATACYCANCYADFCCRYITFGERLDCLFLGLWLDSYRSGVPGVRVRIARKGQPIVDSNLPVKPSGPQLPKPPRVNGSSIEHARGNTSEIAHKEQRPEHYYKDYVHELDKERQKDVAKVKRLLESIRAGWSKIAAREAALSQVKELLNSIQNRQAEVMSRLSEMGPKNLKKRHKGLQPWRKYKWAARHRVPMAHRQKANFYECRTIVKKDRMCFKTLGKCMNFVKKCCLRGHYRPQFAVLQVCSSRSC